MSVSNLFPFRRHLLPNVSAPAPRLPGLTSFVTTCWPGAALQVQFKEFKILGLIPVKAPASAAGELDITYLDDELRISRGNRNNLFVLRMRVGCTLAGASCA